MGLSLLEGNEATAWGAYMAGCRFFAGYPITPATSIYQTMLSLLPPAGGIVMQGEDEIASLGMCLGASMAGLKAMTATSGPGISLYSEHISFAIGSEIPVVIVDVQRLGPSTGSATMGADGDVQFLRWCHSGGITGIVLAPADAADCLTLTMTAFNLAERFRTPVFIASNKEIGLTRESLDIDALTLPDLEERAQAPEGHPFKPFEPNPATEAPWFLPIGGPTLARQTSSTHGEDGYITTDPKAIAQVVERLDRKLHASVADYTYYDADRQAGKGTLVLTYGVTSRATRSALQTLRSEGLPVDLLVLKTLWPVPEELIRAQAKGYDRVLVVEMNLGQYVREVERILGHDGPKVDFFGQMNGKLIAPDAIAEAVRHG